MSSSRINLEESPILMFIRLTFIMIFTLVYSISSGQSMIEWTPNYQLQLSDFQSPETEINKLLSNYSLYSGSNMDFSFNMSAYEFMFTKNFNSKVKTTFNRSAAVIIAPDSAIAQKMVDFGQYDFDLAELYSRKIQKRNVPPKRCFFGCEFF